MLKTQAFANAATVVALALYVVCRVVSLVVPDLLFAISKSWFHTFNLDLTQATTPLDLGTFLVGAVSLAIVTWLIAYSFAAVYNKWTRLQ